MKRTMVMAALFLGGCADDEPMVTDDVGDAEFCEDVATWPKEAAVAETTLLDVVNEARRVGATCDGVEMPPVLALEIIPELRCAARVHARDMAKTGVPDHLGPDGAGPLERISSATYDGFPRHELLATDFLQGAEVSTAWLADPDNCRALMDPDIAHAGPGARRNDAEANIAWVLVTGEPRPE